MKKLVFALWVATFSIPVLAQKPAPVPSPVATSSEAKEATAVDGGAPTYIRPETPEQRLARIGTAEDPGADPDPSKVFWRFGKSQYIEKFKRELAVYEGSETVGWIRPFAPVNVFKELYQQNEKWVWVWIDVPDPALDTPQEDIRKSTERGHRFSDQEVEYLQRVRTEFSELTPPSSDDVVRFEESSSGLPTSGSYRNSLAVADMNGDGHVDLIVPSERGLPSRPVIFLGDGKGNWKQWREVVWPYSLEYGSVAAADFNKDGKMDLAFGVHLKGVYVCLNDGNGKFVGSEEGLPRDYPTRRIAVDDVDRDGYVDVIAISEGPTSMGSLASNAAKIRVFINRRSGTAWEGIDVAHPSQMLGGDWLATGNFNGDKYPDFFGASVYFGSSAIGYMSSGRREWKSLDPALGGVIPYISYYFSNVAGKFSSRKLDDAIVSFVRFWPSDVNPKLIPPPPFKNVAGIDRISFDGASPKRTPIVRWDSSNGVWGMGSGDFDRDGNLDLVYTVFSPREARMLLGDGKGNFRQARIEGLALRAEPNYDVKVADVNADSRPDIILMYETSGGTAFSARTGSVRVFLNRGSGAAATKPAE